MSLKARHSALKSATARQAKRLFPFLVLTRGKKSNPSCLVDRKRFGLSLFLMNTLARLSGSEERRTL